MGNTPSLGDDGGHVIGALELNQCKDCGCCTVSFCPDWEGCDTCKGCCPGIASPSGPEWDAASPGFAPLLEEATVICFKESPKSCGGCCPDVFAMKRILDEKWTGRANEYLKTHNLEVKVLAFVTSDGKSSSPHLVLQFRKADSGPIV